MNQNSAVGEVEVEALEVVDFGDAMVETRQPASFPEIKDNSVTWTWFAAE